jgi:hypothetical protein
MQLITRRPLRSDLRRPSACRRVGVSACRRVGGAGGEPTRCDGVTGHRFRTRHGDPCLGGARGRHPPSGRIRPEARTGPGRISPAELNGSRSSSAVGPGDPWVCSPAGRIGGSVQQVRTTARSRPSVGARRKKGRESRPSSRVRPLSTKYTIPDAPSRSGRVLAGCRVSSEDARVPSR